MTWLLAGLALAVVGVLRSAIEAEAEALLAKVPEWIIRSACRALPRRVRARYRDEMLADLDTEPDRPLWRLATALRVVAGVGRLRWAVRSSAPTPEAVVDDGPDDRDPGRAEGLLGHRSRLVVLARRRLPTMLAGDAEAIVDEAFARALPRWDRMDDARLANLLTETTLALCTEVWRRMERGTGPSAS